MKRSAVLAIFSAFLVSVPALAQIFNGSINPQIAFGGGFATVYQVLHSDTRAMVPAIGRIEFKDPEGVPLSVPTVEMGTGSSFNVTVPYSGTVTLTVLSSAPDVSVGTVRYISMDGVATGSVARYSFGSSVVGVPAAETLTTGYVPLVTDSGFQMGIAVANASSTLPVTVRFDEVLANGTAGQSGMSFTIPPNGQRARIIGSEVGLNNPITSGSSLKVSVVGNGSFAATPLLIGNNFFSSASIFSMNVLETPVYVPQVAIGGSFDTGIDSMNLNGLNLWARLSLFDQTGSPLAATIRSSGAAGNSGPVNASTSTIGPIPANGRVRWDLSTSTALRVGWAKVDWFNSVSGLEIPYPSPASATLHDGPAHVGVPGTRPHYSVAIPINVGNGLNTGVALAFPGKRASTITSKLIDANGNEYSLNDFPTQGAAGTHTARYITEAFKNVPNLTGAYLSIDASADGGPFLPTGLLDSSGVFSSTAVTRRLTHSSAAFSGSYSGNWNNTTFGSSGSMGLYVNVNGSTASMQMTLGGNVFGGPPPPPENWSCMLGPNGCWTTFTSMTFGETTFGLECDGTSYFRSRLPNGGYFGMDGFMNASRSLGDYTVRFGSVAAVGVYNMAKF